MVDYYTTFLDALTHPFLQAFNSLSNPGINMRNLSKAHIAVIPKAISLLNVDLKIFAKILADRLTPIVNTLKKIR